MATARRSFTASLLLGAFAVMFAASSTLALSWGAITPLSAAGTANAWDYGLIASGSRIFAAFRVLDDEGRHVAFRQSTNAGGSFSKAIEISRPEANESYQPSLGYASEVLHAAWVEDTGAGEQVMYRRSGDGGLTWGETRVMTGASVVEVTSPRVFASGDRVFLTYTDGTTGQIFVKRSANRGRTFANREQLGSSTNVGFSTSETFDGAPSMAFGSGVIYFVYRSSALGVRMRRSTDGGMTWKASVSIATRNGSNPVVSATGSRAVISFSYWDSETWDYAAIRRTADKGATWKARQKVSSGTSKPAFEARVLRANDRWRLVYSQCPDTLCEVAAIWYRSSSDGVTWTTPTRISPSTGTAIAFGLAYTSVNKRYWVGWIAGEQSDSDFTVQLRGGS